MLSTKVEKHRIPVKLQIHEGKLHGKRAVVRNWRENKERGRGEGKEGGRGRGRGGQEERRKRRGGRKGMEGGKKQQRK